MKKATFFTLIISSLLLNLVSCKSGSSDKNIITFTTDNFRNETAEGIVLVDFWASWCMPCKAMAPVVEEIASQTKGKVKVGKVDIDANGSLANQFWIKAIPTIIIFKDGQAVEKLVGIQSRSALINALSKYVAVQ
jgi:thioredoxin 1